MASLDDIGHPIKSPNGCGNLFSVKKGHCRATNQCPCYVLQAEMPQKEFSVGYLQALRTGHVSETLLLTSKTVQCHKFLLQLSHSLLCFYGRWRAEWIYSFTPTKTVSYNRTNLKRKLLLWYQQWDGNGAALRGSLTQWGGLHQGYDRALVRNPASQPGVRCLKCTKDNKPC